jgi:hypothetical protein
MNQSLKHTLIEMRFIMTYIEDNTQLGYDLNALWINNHLTADHTLWLRRRPCQKDDDSNCRKVVHHLETHGEPCLTSAQLLIDIEALAAQYQFDQLEAWPCPARCGNIIFKRTIGDFYIDDLGKRHTAAGSDEAAVALGDDENQDQQALVEKYRRGNSHSGA